MQQSI